MKALALFTVLIVAKAAMLAGRPVQFDGWMLLAYFWQDALVALAFWAIDKLLILLKSGRVASWVLYGVVVGYVAINVPVARVLSSPLTWPMMSAARGTLADSIKHHATAVNLSIMGLIAASGFAVPVFLQWISRRIEQWRPLRVPMIFPMILVVLFLGWIGPLATARIDTQGMGRNAITALATTVMPRITAREADLAKLVDWRISPIDDLSRVDGISDLRGQAAGRNVVMIVLESAGAQYLKPYGAAVDPMPNISELAATSIVFENAYTVYPESIKGLLAVLCSRYPAMDTKAESYAGITTPSIADVLNRNGYRTALYHSGRFMYLGMEGVVRNRGFEVLEDAAAIGGNKESSFGVDESSTVRRALSWVDSLEPGERFFMTYLPVAGHHPYDTPERGPFPARAESDNYLNALHYADKSVGTLIRGLRDRGLERQTLFVIFGDHGEAFGQHNGNYGHSLYLYDENLRVPFLIAVPCLTNKQMRIAPPISLVDAAPTILDLLGLAAPDEYQGLSALDGKPAVALFYTDYSLSLIGLRDGCWKYIYELESGRSKLFDICVDPAETNDLASSNSKRVAAYRDHLSNWASAQKAHIVAEVGNR